MAEFPKINNPDDPTEFNFSDLIDPDQWLNMVVGINRGADGVIQSAAEMMELMGLEPDGHAEFVTQELKRDQEILKGSAAHAQDLSGAAGFEFIGEVLPLFAVPLGRSTRAAAALGGIASAGFFQDDVTESRLDDIAFGAAAGGIFAKLLRGGKAKGELDTAVKQLALPAPQAQRLLSPPQAQRLLPSPNSRAGLTAQDFVPATATRPPTRGEVLAQRSTARMREVIKAGTKEGNDLAGRALKKITEFGRKASERAARLKQAVGRSTKHDKKLIDEAQRADNSAVAASVMRNSISDAISTGYKNLDRRHPNSLTSLNPTADVRKVKGPAALPASVTQQSLPAPARQLEGSKPVSDMTKKELLDNIKAANSSLKGLAKKNKAELEKIARTLDEVTKKSSTAGPQTLGGRQSGFINTDLQSTLSGAAVGGLGAGALGGAVSGDSEGALVSGLVGAIAGGAIGARLARSLEKVADNGRRAQMRAVSKADGEATATLSRNIKVKNFTSDAISDALQSASKLADEFLGSTMTRLEMLAPRIATALKQAEFQQHVRKQEWLSAGESAFTKMDDLKLTTVQDRALKIALLNSTESAKRVLRGLGKDSSFIDDFSRITDEIGDYLKTADLGGGLRKNYFPRMVTNTGFFENIPEFKTYLSELAKKKGVPELTGFEKEIALTEAINGALLRGDKNTVFGRAASQLQRRSIKVTDKNVDAYANPKEGWSDYIESITTQVERRNFFKGQGVKVDDLGPNAENIDSIAKRLAVQMSKGDLTEEAVDEAARLIRMRFGPGEQAPHRAVQNFKNITYMGLLGNPMSAATQFGDLALSMHRNGIGNTVTAALGQIMGKGKINGIDKEDLLGIRNAATDFASRVSTRDALNFSLRYSGFQKMDQFGKNTFIQGAMLKSKKQGPEEFKERWGKIFDPDAPAGAPTPRTDELYQKVQSFEKITPENREDIGFMLWNELSDVQPIALSALPERYLRHPNGRMAYMLQSFTLKLFDVMRKDIKHKQAAGDITGAVKNAVKLSTLFVATNGSVDSFKDFMTGKEQNVPQTVLDNYLKLMGMNKYMVDSIGTDGLGDTLLKQAAPPMAVPNAIFDPKQALKMTPLIGRNLEALLNDK